ncbi:hypothetical protein HK102_005602 [Quaeritorhiza haematococci]|nr:hypothetical protein HK102_005602 [Quaeritorhiza haematococci]
MGLLPELPWLVQTTINVTLISVTGALFLLYYFQNDLIYAARFPAGSRKIVATPNQMHMNDWEDLTLTTPDNVKIKAYLIHRKKSGASTSAGSATNETNPDSEFDAGEGLRKRAVSGQEGKDDEEWEDTTLLYLHANAGNMGHRLPIAFIFYQRLKCNIFMLSYRGYGLSEGSASEKGIRIDAQTAMDYIKSHPKLKNTKLIVYGQSIGAAVSIDLVSRNPGKVSALIVENTFLSMPKLIPHVMPALRYVAFLCHQKWNSEEAVKKIEPEVPMLFLSGLQDELVPAAHMKALFQTTLKARLNAVGAAKNDSEKGKEKDDEDVDVGLRWGEFPHGTHNDTCLQEGYFLAIEKFWDEVQKKFGGDKKNS